MGIIKKLESVLEEESIFPITKETWQCFNINHRCPADHAERKEQYEFIKDKVRNKAGIYIYKKDEQIIYIGKAKLLYDRLKSHYIESFSPVPGDTKDMRWHRFFSEHNGEVKVYWKEFEYEEERWIVNSFSDNFFKGIHSECSWR